MEHEPKLVEAVARGLACGHGLDWDEPCGYNDGAGECDSGTCIASHHEDHDPEYARACYLSDARRAITALRTHERLHTARAERRECIATAAMQGLLAGPYRNTNNTSQFALEFADTLIAALDAEGGAG